MDTLTAIHSRRAVKHFDPDHRMTEEEIRTLMHAAVQSPTAFNMQNWRFVLVTDPALRQRIRAASDSDRRVVGSAAGAVGPSRVGGQVDFVNSFTSRTGATESAFSLYSCEAGGDGGGLPVGRCGGGRASNELALVILVVTGA